MPPSQTYGFWDGALETALTFPELKTIDPSSAKWRNRLVETTNTRAVQGQEINCWFDASGASVLRVVRSDDGILLDVPSRATFLLPNSIDGEISYSKDKTLAAASLRHQILNVILPLNHSRRGDLILHGSAVEVDGKAVAFVGKGGSGKSTLAALVAQFWRGAVLADDSLLITTNGSRSMLFPTYNGLRLTHKSRELLGAGGRLGDFEAYDHKDFLRAERFAGAPVALHAIFFVAATRNGPPAIRPLGFADAFAAIAGHAFILDPKNSASLATQFRLISKLNALTKTFRFDYPHTGGPFADSAKLLASHLSPR